MLDNVVYRYVDEQVRVDEQARSGELKDFRKS